jgi:hypothetical protein
MGFRHRGSDVWELLTDIILLDEVSIGEVKEKPWHSRHQARTRRNGCLGFWFFYFGSTYGLAGRADLQIA